jgi:alkanesulfonate monooxygenase SsuD/methylene tetrahydromethanopterin reductase-like flavin-dependent oxidoreductase (luciferase family)
VGGTGDRILRLAAEQADIISIAWAFQAKGQPPGTMRISTAAEADERVRYTRECAGERADHIEWHALTQVVVETDDRRASAGKLAKRFGHLMSPKRCLGGDLLRVRPAGTKVPPNVAFGPMPRIRGSDIVGSVREPAHEGGQQ